MSELTEEPHTTCVITAYISEDEIFMSYPFTQNKSQLVSIFQISSMQKSLSDVDEMTMRPFGMPLALRVSCENDEAKIPPQVVQRKNR